MVRGDQGQDHVVRWRQTYGRRECEDGQPEGSGGMTHGHMQGATVIAGIQVGFMEELAAPPEASKKRLKRCAENQRPGQGWRL